jgi:hypothetical protein
MSPLECAQAIKSFMDGHDASAPLALQRIQQEHQIDPSDTAFVLNW